MSQQDLFRNPLSRPPVAVAWGAGVDSTAMIIEMHRRGEPIDIVLHALTKWENPLTDRYVEYFTRWMDQHAKVGQYGFMVRDPGAGRVLRGPGGRALIHYPLVPSVLRRLQEGAAVLAELLLRGGATEVLTGLGKQRFVHTVAEAEAIRRLPLTATDYRIAAFHPLGTCRMGASPQTSVVDFDHRVHGTDNLYVIDGSSVPTSLGVDPQVTIMAMASRAASGLAARLG